MNEELELKKLINIENKKILEATSTRNDLLNKLYELRISKVDTTFEKFKIWLESEVQDGDYYYALDIVSRNNTLLFGYSSFIQCERHQRIDLYLIHSSFEDMLYSGSYSLKMSEEEFEYQYGAKKEDVLDWMNKLMELNFNSMVYDW